MKFIEGLTVVAAMLVLSIIGDRFFSGIANIILLLIHHWSKK